MQRTIDFIQRVTMIAPDGLARPEDETLITIGSTGDLVGIVLRVSLVIQRESKRAPVKLLDEGRSSASNNSAGTAGWS
jgi:hypothetical protein